MSNIEDIKRQVRDKLRKYLSDIIYDNFEGTMDLQLTDTDYDSDWCQLDPTITAADKYEYIDECINNIVETEIEIMFKNAPKD